MSSPVGAGRLAQPLMEAASNATTKKCNGRMADPDPSGSADLRSTMVKKVLAPSSALRRHTRTDRAAHAGAAKPAIAHGILGEVLLVVVLGEVERRRVQDLRRDRVEALRLERLLVHRLRCLGSLPLDRKSTRLNSSH